VKILDIAARKMTTAEIFEAQDLARDWEQLNYKGD
jgi:hypothetical protein